MRLFPPGPDPNAFTPSRVAPPGYPIGARPPSSKRAMDLLRQLKAERDRFVAFAFASAELLIEIDANRRITYASGVLARLRAKEIEALAGQPLADMVSADDRPVLEAALERLERVGRIEPLPLHCRVAGTPVPVLMGGCRLPTAGSGVFLTFTSRGVPADPPPRAPDDWRGQRKDFEEKASLRFREAVEQGLDPHLSLLVVEGLTRLRETCDESQVEEFLSRLRALLRIRSLGGNTSGPIEAEKFGLMHAGELDGDELASEVGQLAARTVGDGTIGVKTFTVDLDVGDLTEADAVRTMLFAIRKFAREGGDPFEFGSLSEGVQRIVDQSAQRVADLRDAIEKRSFDLVFQPIVKTESGEIAFFEALTRFIGQPTSGAAFGFAEDIGLIEDLDLVIVERVLDELKNKAMTGWRPSIAVNLSARTLESRIFTEAMSRILDGRKDLLGQLLVELTETVAVRDFEALNETLRGMRESGVRVCLDDVGSGSTSFESLRRLDVDFVKLDGELIAGAGNGQRDLTILDSVCQLCTDLEVPMIGEHVESPEQARFLEKMSIGFGQGYHFGRPVSDYQTRYGEMRSAAPKRGRRKGSQPTWG